MQHYFQSARKTWHGKDTKQHLISGLVNISRHFVGRFLFFEIFKVFSMNCVDHSQCLHLLRNFVYLY